MVRSRQTSTKTASGYWSAYWSLVSAKLVLKPQALTFKRISAFGKGNCSLGIRIYSLHISPSSSPWAQSLMKSHACPSLIAVPFQQLKEPSRDIFEPEADPREKENKPHFRLLSCLLLQQVIGSCGTPKRKTPCEIPSTQ